MKLTKRQIKQIHRACELLETEQAQFGYSCYALAQAENVYLFDSKLAPVYGKFFDESIHQEVWFNIHVLRHKFKHERIMCLLMFAEAAGDVL